MAASSLFSTHLTSTPENFLTPDLPLHTDILAYLKNLLDPIAKDVSAVQDGRLREARKKRKRGDASISDEGVLRLKQVYTQNLGIEQIWEQTRRIIDATRYEAQLVISQAQQAAEIGEEDDRLSDEDEDEVVDGAEFDDEADGSENSVDGIDGIDGIDEEDEEDLDSDGQITNDALHDEEMDLDSEDMDDGDLEPAEEPAELVQDKFGLNDGFFSIDDFNRQSEFLEQQDARGGDDGAASDEEDVDWDNDPLTLANDNTTKTTAESEDDEDDDENGPTFGDADAASISDDGELEDDDMQVGGLGNTNEVMYTDFFAPPAQKKRKGKKGRPNPHNFPPEVQDEEVDRTIAAVQRDLFEDEDDGEDEEGETEQMDPDDPLSRRSTHEKRKAAIAEEIRKLEAANVARREWALSGEAKASDRPLNSLLEQDLEFERAGKPVPVITAEVSESLEELIKRRILAHDFQDIPRRRPDDLATGKDGRRGRIDFTLDDTKSKKGLAEEYEEEHLRQNDPNFVDLKDEKLAKEQKEIEELWKEVSSKLDSLSSWHFQPKRPTAQLDIKVDAPTITMEDARPSIGGEVAAASQLAPQEIYKGGESSKLDNLEVAGKSGLPARREELSREEKKRRRRREKERIHKAQGNLGHKPEQSKAAKEKKQVTSDLRRGGVKVIGKKGEVTDTLGNADVGSTQNVNAARLKL